MGFLKRKRPAVPAPASLRAETSQGDRYEDPSEDLLFMLTEDLQQVQDYFIVEDAGDATGQTYAQVMREADGFLIERRRGSEDTHEHAKSADLREVHEDLTTWAFAIQREDVLPWQPGFPTS